MSTTPDPDRPCVAPLDLGVVACAYVHEHPHEVSHYAVGESDGMHWSLFWWNRAAVSERPEETASRRLPAVPPATTPDATVTLTRDHLIKLLEQAHTVGAADMCRHLIGEWPRETMSPRAAQSFLRAVQEEARHRPTVQPSLADRLRELLAFVDDRKPSHQWVHAESLRALLEPEA